MTPYLFGIIWVIGSIVSYEIARKRKVRITAVKNIAFALFGPLGIPVVFFLKPEKKLI